MNTPTTAPRRSPQQRVSSTTVRSHIAGEPDHEDGTAVPLVDPATGAVWGEAVVSPAAVHRAVAAAEQARATSGWAQLQGWQRAEVLRRLGALIARDAADLAEYETLANGKPLRSTTAEMTVLQRWYDFFAAAAETHTGSYRSLSPTRDGVVVEEPVGVVAAITPFNGALSLGSWKIAPALAVGNSVVVKPPVHAAASTARLAELALEAGLPPGVLNVVVGGAEEGAALAADERVDLVSFTGSTAVARRLGAVVAGRLGRFVCEAGGKSAHIVMDDADLGSAVIAVAQGLFSATGQTCVAGSRILVHEAIAAEFTARLKAHAAHIVVGDPYEGGTHLGPVASSAQLERIEGFVDDALARGAQPLFGGTRVEPGAELAGGNWFPPTVLEATTEDMAVCSEEVFGPVGVLHVFGSAEEALEIANSVEYGLAAGVWSASADTAHRMSRGLAAGTVWVNTYRAIDWRMPFGGYKQSGLGRENGLEAMREFTQVKSVVQDYGPHPDPFAIA
ncbi:aldehyde dehydrogenase family protein [Nocardiopsis ansamitocini]|uniref:Aldehyde dehydrogenase n=1 Tax=Nocardiopsis ansamitocini TaxID=1670832 RepID=A0A9W6P832_9ACTN|nr:aldehyde dehydrogenase family protein [Nocardiopsis ansamitocini]GLU48741.1 aldehyde dehydrogenase [Nocardiopsis ansamitocini]